MHAGQCGRIAQDAEASRVVLSHFYPIAERYAVRQQAQRRYDGRVLMAKDRLKLEV
jgi:ribonuclease BN (tRNA processing enzyme)